MKSGTPEYYAAYYRANLERYRALRKARYLVNREEVLKKAKIQYQEKRELILEKLKTVEERVIGRERKRQQYAHNPEKFRLRRQEWVKANRHKIREYFNVPERRLHSNVSRAIRGALRANKAGRSWESLVGFSLVDLVSHLEKQFLSGMTWENYGEWEIDHKRPKSSFKFTTADDPEFKVCWALSNLQPMWMSENRRKWARWGDAA